MSWTPSSVSRSSTYSEGQGWTTVTHDVWPGERIGMRIRVKGTVTQAPCTLVVGFLSKFDSVEWVWGEKILSYTAGALDITVDIYGYWDPHGLPACTKVGTYLYAYDKETGTRFDAWVSNVFHCALLTDYTDLHAWYNIATPGYVKFTGIDASVDAPLAIANGLKWAARIDFMYKAAVSVTVTLVVELILPADQLLEGAHSSIFWNVTLAPASDWTYVSSYCPIENSGIWGTKLADGRRVDAVKSIREGSTIKLSDADSGVFMQVVAVFDNLQAVYS